MLGTNIVRQVFTQIIGLVSGFVVSVITARLLGPEGRGNFALILNTSNFISLLLGFSFGTSIVHVISANKMPYRSTINTFSVLIFVLILICSFSLLFFPFLKYSFLLPANSGSFLFYIFILLTLFIISLYSTLFNSILSGKKLFPQQQKVYLSYSILSIIFYSLLFLFRLRLALSFNQFLIFYSFITFILTLGAFIMYRRHARPPQTFSFLNYSQIKYILGFSLLAYLCNFFHFLCIRMDFWIVEYFNGSRSLGLYSLPVNLAQMLWLLPQAISTVLLAYSGAESLQNGIQKTNILARIAMAFIFLLSIFLFFTIDFLIPFLFGGEFKGSAILFKLLLIGIIPFCATTILSSYFGGTGQMKINLYCSLIGFLLSLIFDLILIPRYGTIGAAIATGISYFTSTAFIILVYLQKTKSTLNDLLIIKKEDINLVKNKLFLLLRKKKQ